MQGQLQQPLLHKPQMHRGPFGCGGLTPPTVACVAMWNVGNLLHGYMSPIQIPMEPMGSIELGVFHCPSTSHDKKEHDHVLLCVRRLDGYLIVMPIPRSNTQLREDGIMGKCAAHLVLEKWVDCLGAPQEMCCECGAQFWEPPFPYHVLKNWCSLNA